MHSSTLGRGRCNAGRKLQARRGVDDWTRVPRICGASLSGAVQHCDHMCDTGSQVNANSDTRCVDTDRLALAIEVAYQRAKVARDRQQIETTR